MARRSQAFAINVDGAAFLSGSAPQAMTEFETGKPKVTEDGTPIYSVQLIWITNDGEGSALIDVRVAGEPKIALGQPVKVTGLSIQPWSITGDRGGTKSGFTWRAESVTSLNARAAS